MRRRVAGVYVVRHATDSRKVYVGEAADCELRNAERARLGLIWHVVQLMPRSTQKERRVAETAIADVWEGRGYQVLSHNTSRARKAFYKKNGLKRRGRKLTPEHIAKVVAKTKGQKRTPEFRAKMAALQTGKKASASTRRKISEHHRKAWADPEYHARMCAIRKRTWADPAFKEKMREAHRKTA